ncbi:MAG: hypothetical protein ACLT9S_15820 [Faecalibacterium sp.]
MAGAGSYVVVLAGGWWLLKPKSAKPANVDTSYTEVMPETRDVSNTLSVTGTLNPGQYFTVSNPLVSGKVLTGGFEEGDIVEEGTDALHGGFLRRYHQGWSRQPSPCSRRSAATTRPPTASMCVLRWRASSAA